MLHSEHFVLPSPIFVAEGLCPGALPACEADKQGSAVEGQPCLQPFRPSVHPALFLSCFPLRPLNVPLQYPWKWRKYLWPLLSTLEVLSNFPGGGKRKIRGLICYSSSNPNLSSSLSLMHQPSPTSLKTQGDLLSPQCIDYFVQNNLLMQHCFCKSMLGASRETEGEKATF